MAHMGRVPCWHGGYLVVGMGGRTHKPAQALFAELRPGCQERST